MDSSPAMFSVAEETLGVFCLCSSCRNPLVILVMKGMESSWNYLLAPSAPRRGSSIDTANHQLASGSLLQHKGNWMIICIVLASHSVISPLKRFSMDKCAKKNLSLVTSNFLTLSVLKKPLTFLWVKHVKRVSVVTGLCLDWLANFRWKLESTASLQGINRWVTKTIQGSEPVLGAVRSWWRIFLGSLPVKLEKTTTCLPYIFLGGNKIQVGTGK